MKKQELTGSAVLKGEIPPDISTEEELSNWPEPNVAEYLMSLEIR